MGVRCSIRSGGGNGGFCDFCLLFVVVRDNGESSELSGNNNHTLDQTSIQIEHLRKDCMVLHRH